MNKWEKAIRGLKICLNTGNFDSCTEVCPYFTKELGLGVCSENMQRDALELLKAQEARVMTLEEAKNSEFCFCESGSVFVCHIFVDPADGFVTIQQFGKPDFLIDSNEYGISFRCWTAYPTDKQREETKWK